MVMSYLPGSITATLFFLTVAISFFVFAANALHGFANATWRVAASHHELIESSCQRRSTIAAVSVVDFLIGAAIRHHCFVRKTMGKGNGVDKGHGIKKEAPTG